MAQRSDAYVVDASVAVKWYLAGEVLEEHAGILLDRFQRNEITLTAPMHIHCEVPSAIVSATRGNSARYSVDQGRRTIEEFLDIGLRTIPTEYLVLDAFSLVHEYDVSIYDSLYLAMTIDFDIPLVTADARFYRRVSSLPNVQWLGDIGV